MRSFLPKKSDSNSSFQKGDSNSSFQKGDSNSSFQKGDSNSSFQKDIVHTQMWECHLMVRAVGRVAAYPQVDILVSRYKSVNFIVEMSPDPLN
jgi:hypothetical protein